MVRRRKEKLHVFFHHIQTWPNSKALVKRLQFFFIRFNNDQKKIRKGYMFFCGILRWPKE